MTQISCGLFSELLLVRLHGRAEAYLRAHGTARDAIVAACRREATVPDLAHRILSRTIYSQASSRVGPLRELLQNALDASPPSARIDVRSSEDGREISVIDHGRGMTGAELLTNLLVPFRSGKEGDPEAIGEHGIGFFSALEIAPRIDVVTLTSSGGHRLVIGPIGAGPRHEDFAWTLMQLPAPSSQRGPTGTSVRLTLAHRTARPALAAAVAAAVGLVDPTSARIYVDGVLINIARPRLRRVSEVSIRLTPAGAPVGALALFVGRGDGIEPQLTITQKGITVAARVEPFPCPELGLHREISRAITAAGFGLVAELPLGVPLNKGRSGVSAAFASAFEEALVLAFERFILRDALYDRELLRAADHRLSSVLDRLLGAALLGETITIASAQAVDELDPAARTPTVAAPEEVIRFANGLLDTRLFRAMVLDASHRSRPALITLRELLQAHRAGILRPESGGAGRAASRGVPGGARDPGAAQDRAPPPPPSGSEPAALVYLSMDEPLAQAFWRRLASDGTAAQAASPPGAQRGRGGAPVPMQRTPRDVLLATAADVPGVRAVAAAMTIIERLDAAVSQAADLSPSPIWVHQDLYGPDEMAHTDGNGISVNLASQRVRALLTAVLESDDPVAFSALTDLLLHEKTHVSLASYVPRPAAEHGTSFYRRKDWLRRRLLSALSTGAVADPIGYLPVARRGLASGALPAPEALARAFQLPAAA
jgi:Histidine kinase-, DNA gyrase B-, and HSP90-like ATPase